MNAGVVRSRMAGSCGRH